MHEFEGKFLTFQLLIYFACGKYYFETGAPYKIN